MDLRGLSLICAGLGIADEDIDGNRIGYTKSDYCLDNLKDLLRFLRRDDPQTREVFKQVCKWSTVSKDLIPIIEHCQDDHTLVLNAVKVLVFLTMPVDPSSSDIPQQIEYLWGLKSSITHSNTVAVIVSLLESPLENLENESFTEDDWKLVELILTLVRNILAIQDISFQQKACGSASQFITLRDKFLELLFHENVMDLILVITQHGGGSYLRQNNLLLLENFHYIFLGHNPELIARVHTKSSKVDEDTGASLDNLKSIMEKEKEKRRLSVLRKSARHSQFSGTFTRLTMNGSKNVIKGNPIPFPCATLHKPHKAHRGPVNKIVWDHERLPFTNDKILELMHDFLNQFLAGGYNDLMQSVCEDIEKEHPAIQKSDIVVFFNVAQFVTSFQYHKFLNLKPNMDTEKSGTCSDDYVDNTHFKGDLCGPIAASMNESMFLLVISRWRSAYEGLKETKDYKFLSAAGSLMKIMINMLDMVLYESPQKSREPQTARILLYKLFYDQTDEGMTQFLLNLIKSFDTHKQPKSDLADLVEMINVIVKLMENLQACGTLRVSKKSRKGRKSKPMSDKNQAENEPSGDFATVQERNGVPSSVGSADIGLSCEASLVDASTDGKRVSNVIRVDGPELPVSEMGNHEGTLPLVDSKKSDNGNDDVFDGMSNSSGDEQHVPTDEVDFKMSTLISAFANNHIIQNLCWLLKFYKSNSSSTNQYIISFLQRITDDLELSPMLYQLSLLTIFYEILAEQKSCSCEEYDDIVSFLTTLVRKMLKKMKTQPLLFVEVLSWKSRRECHYINTEYLSHEIGKLKEQSKAWGNAPGDGDMGLSHSKGWTHRNIADALGEDEADVVISHDLNHNNVRVNSGESEEETSNSEIKRQKHSDNMETFMEHKAEKVSARKRRFVLSDEMEIKIMDLYEKFKDDRSCSRLNAEALHSDGNISPAQVANKLKQLGLKVGTKKMMRYNDVVFPANQPGEEVRSLEREISPNTGLKESLHTQSSYTRKKERAFSEDQEAMIKTLFQKFKDHKRCSYMIANALEADKAFTAAQISRKLKQLGLFQPKKTEGDLHLRDEEVINLSMDNIPESDDEILSSLRNRSKNKGGTRLDGTEQSTSNTKETLSKDDSDDKILISVFKNKKSQGSRVGSELPNPNIGGTLLEDDSDDDFLSSVLKSKKTHSTRAGAELPKPNIGGTLLEAEDEDKCLTSVLKKTRTLRRVNEEKVQRWDTTSNENFGGVSNEEATERGGNSQVTDINDAGSDEDDVEKEDNSEAKVNEKKLDVSAGNSVDDLQEQQMEDLWDDGVASGGLSNNGVSRGKRKFKIVDEDDE